MHVQSIHKRYGAETCIVLLISNQRYPAPVASVLYAIFSACSFDILSGAVYILQNIWNGIERNTTERFLHLGDKIKITGTSREFIQGSIQLFTPGNMLMGRTLASPSKQTHQPWFALYSHEHFYVRWWMGIAKSVTVFSSNLIVGSVLERTRIDEQFRNVDWYLKRERVRPITAQACTFFRGDR